jgi:hypothetical protein
MPKQQHRHEKSNPGSADTTVSDQGIVRNELGEEQPRDKERALHVAREDKGNDPPGHQPRNNMPQR